jgi:kynurenine formamidase
MPQRRAHPQYLMTLVRRHGDVTRPSGMSSANELVVLSGHTGTHLDALGHVAMRGRLHGGKRSQDLETHEGLRALDIASVAPIVARFVLFDVAGETGGPPLPPGHAVTARYLETVAQKTGVSPSHGDVALVRTGWGALWSEPRRYQGEEGGIAGIDLSAAEWLAARGVSVIGADNMTVEVEAPDAPELPVHAFAIVEKGIYLLENLFLEELAKIESREGLVVIAPLRLVGATGAPVRPIALA